MLLYFGMKPLKIQIYFPIPQSSSCILCCILHGGYCCSCRTIFFFSFSFKWWKYSNVLCWNLCFSVISLLLLLFWNFFFHHFKHFHLQTAAMAVRQAWWILSHIKIFAHHHYHHPHVKTKHKNQHHLVVLKSPR